MPVAFTMVCDLGGGLRAVRALRDFSSCVPLLVCTFCVGAKVRPQDQNPTGYLQHYIAMLSLRIDNGSVSSGGTARSRRVALTALCQ
eukprot:194707-Lingulodinium_polyedra.AAC.1